MSSSGTTDNSRILIVSDVEDAEVRDCTSALRSTGASVEVVPDVYAAVARLALGKDIVRVLLDIRTLDDKEMSFLRVASRYVPSVHVVVPSFSGTAQRAEAYGAGVQVVDVASIVASITDERAPEPPSGENGPSASAPSAGAPSTAAPSAEVISTNGESGPRASVPSLHQAVRQRMAGDDPRAVRRRPPSADPAQPEPAPPPSAPAPVPAGGSPESSHVGETPGLSAEEVEALLADEEAGKPHQAGADEGDAGEAS